MSRLSGLPLFNATWKSLNITSVARKDVNNNFNFITSKKWWMPSFVLKLLSGPKQTETRQTKTCRLNLNNYSEEKWSSDIEVPKSLYDEICLENEKLWEKYTENKVSLALANHDLEQTKKKLAEVSLPIAIRCKIEFWEHMLAPEFEYTGKLGDNEDYVNYHRERWAYILKKKTDDPSVIKFKDFLKKIKVNDDTAATRIAGFFSYNSAKIHLPETLKLSELEIENTLRNVHSINDDVIISLIIFMVKKL